ncbi:hypothetical protein D3C84_341660 [compost metagenome]
MRTKLEKQLKGRLAELLPGYVVQCAFAADGVLAVAVEKPATGESWLITGVAMQSLIGRERLAETVEQILFEISVFSGATPLLLTMQESNALK